MNEQKYDLIIIGAGPGGYEGAIYAAKHGLKVAIIEKGTWGGVCLHSGCIPTKSLLKSGHVYNSVNKEGNIFGINKFKEISPNWKQFQERKSKIITSLNGAIHSLMKSNKIDEYKGLASAVDKNTITINGNILNAPNIIIATGSTPKTLPIKGFDEGIKKDYILNSSQILDLKAIPKSITIIGGGVIGIEFALLFGQLNSKVTIVEVLPSILANLDVGIAKEITKVLTSYNVEIITKANISDLKEKALNIVDSNDKKRAIKSDIIFQAVGRKPNTKDLTALNLSLDKRGFIIVNEYFQTSEPNIYAIGDVNGTLMLAHVATAQCQYAVKHILNKVDKPLNINNIPSVVYTEPEIGCVGKTEKQLQDDGIDFVSETIQIKTIGKAWVDNATDGYIKVLTDPVYGQIYGATVIANGASDMIAYFALAMQCEITMLDIAQVIFPHPTISEAIMQLAHKWVEKHFHK